MAENAKTIFRFIINGVFPLSHIASNLFIILSGGCLILYYLKYVFFYTKWEKLTFGKISKMLLIFAVAMLLTMAARSMELESYSFVDYPGYIEEMPTKSSRVNRRCNYPDPESGEKIKVYGYLPFINDFNGISNVEIVEDPSFNTGIRMEVFYKGNVRDVRLNDYESYDYDTDKTTIEYRISMYDDSYGRELTVDDYIYMYKNHVNVEYSYNYAVEKVVLYTAYPDLLDISEIECA